jgi:hypothetical protein
MTLVVLIYIIWSQFFSNLMKFAQWSSSVMDEAVWYFFLCLHTETFSEVSRTLWLQHALLTLSILIISTRSIFFWLLSNLKLFSISILQDYRSSYLHDRFRLTWWYRGGVEIKWATWIPIWFIHLVTHLLFISGILILII